jgi:hypothetical protein
MPLETLALRFLGAWFVVRGALLAALLVPLPMPLRRWRPGPSVRLALARVDH